MNRLLLGLSLLLPSFAAVACRGSPATEERTALPPGVVAIVGTESILLSTVERIASAQGVSLEEAQRRAIQDALFANAAQDRRAAWIAHGALRTALARALLESFMSAARAEGPPTDEEVDLATRRRWWELDRPVLVRTTHAVVRVTEETRAPPARALAEQIAAAAGRATTAAEFRAAALAVPHAGFELKVEDLMPVAADGRALDPANPPPPGSEVTRYSAAYAAAALAIPAAPAPSPVVRSEFGYHVILAVERLPEKRIPLEERRELLAAEIHGQRAARLRDEAVKGARANHPVQIERAALDLTERAQALP